jgi:hypothetical protein
MEERAPAFSRLGGLAQSLGFFRSPALSFFFNSAGSATFAGLAIAALASAGLTEFVTSWVILSMSWTGHLKRWDCFYSQTKYAAVTILGWHDHFRFDVSVLPLHSARSFDSRKARRAG